MDGTARGRTGPAEDIPDVERTIPMPSVLFVLTGARHWTLQDGSEHPTGFWAEELVAPYNRFEQAGWTVRRIKIDDGCYEVDGRDRAGRAIEVKVHPGTLQIVNIEYEDEGDKDGSRRSGHKDN